VDVSKQVRQLTKSLQKGQGAQSRRRSDLDKGERLAGVPEDVVNAIDRLWDRMVAIKGRAWTTQWGDTEGEHFVTWCEMVKDLTVEQIILGFKTWMDSPDEFLDAKKFRRLCKPEKSEHDSNWQAYKVLPRSARLEDKGKKERSDKARQKVMDEIRKKL